MLKVVEGGAKLGAARTDAEMRCVAGRGAQPQLSRPTQQRGLGRRRGLCGAAAHGRTLSECR